MHNPVEYKSTVAKSKAKRRNIKLSTMEGRKAMFDLITRNGPIFGCVCCHTLNFDSNVIALKDDFKDNLEECFPGLFIRAIGSFEEIIPISVDDIAKDKKTFFLCLYCKKYLFQGKMIARSKATKQSHF